MKTNKLNISDMPAVILTFIFIALIGGVGMIILGEFADDSSLTGNACTTTGYTYYNATGNGCYNGSASGITYPINESSGLAFVQNSQVGLSKIGSKLGLIGTIIVLSIIIGLVVTYFAVKNM